LQSKRQGTAGDGIAELPQDSGVSPNPLPPPLGRPGAHSNLSNGNEAEAPGAVRRGEPPGQGGVKIRQAQCGILNSEIRLPSNLYSLRSVTGVGYCDQTNG